MKLQIRSITTTAATVLLLLVWTVVALQHLPSTNAVPAPYELTRRQIADFRRDGVIVVRGMLEGETLDNAVKAVQTIQRKQGWAKRLVHKIVPIYRNLGFQTYRKHEALKTVAFDSTAPTICAKLMGLDEECKQKSTATTKDDDATKNNPRSLRLLKEAIMGFSKGDMGCGWHVDDKTFWPCVDSHQDNPQDSTISNNKRGNNNKSSRKDAGINVWISLSPVNAEEGGGLAVAPGSHNLTGRGRTGKILRRARIAIASMGGATTCALAKLDSASNDYMEATKRVYNLQPGDAIVHDRYLFHKPDNFKENNDNDGDEDKNNNTIVTNQRISLRYMPSDATFFDNGLGVDGAVNHKNLQTGDPLWKAGEYFPQAWPCQLEAEAKAHPRQDVDLLGTKFLKQIVASMLKKKK